jgi:hypothetical protein
MKCQIQDTTTPLGANTYVLLDTFTALGGITLETHNITRYELIVNNTQIGTIQLLRSETGVPATYRIFQSYAVTIPGAPAVDSGPIDFAVQGVDYLKVQWVNGGSNQTTWNPVQNLVEKQRAAQT